MDRFVLIDGNAIMHRAFHALPPLTSTDGEVVNAVYGFFSMFLKILEDVKPQYIAVCFDRPAPTFRQQLYVGYQAHRPKMADGLSPQFGIVHEILEKIGVQIFEVDGYEADDLIGTIATKAIQSSVFSSQLSDSGQSVGQFISRDRKTDKSKNFNLKTENREPITEVIIVSGDRDLLQLVNSHVKMLAPVTGITNMMLFDAAKVEEKYGLKPSQFIDYKALVGDQSDGYPGVSGIGPKTASELLKKYGTFEEIYKHFSELPEKLSKSLATDAEQASLAKKLATIITDAPIQFEIKKCDMKCFDTEVLKKEFEDLGFKSLLKRLEGSENGNGKEGENGKKKNGNVPKQLGLL